MDRINWGGFFLFLLSIGIIGFGIFCCLTLDLSHSYSMLFSLAVIALGLASSVFSALSMKARLLASAFYLVFIIVASAAFAFLAYKAIF